MAVLPTPHAARAIACCLLAASLAQAGGAVPVLRGRESWGGIKAHPAVVNPVVRPPDDPDALSLRGTWDFFAGPAYRHYNSLGYIGLFDGTRRGWDDPKRGRKIRVPGCWEAQGVGTNAVSRPWICTWDCCPKPIRHAFWGDGWYRKYVKLPASWKGKRIWLKMGIVGTEGRFWLNGLQVADVSFYCGSSKYEVTDIAKPGETNVVVAIVCNSGPGRMGCENEMNTWGGIQRDVEFEATPMVFIDDAWIRGLFDERCAEAHVSVAFGGEGWKDAGERELRVAVDGNVVRRRLSYGVPPDAGDACGLRVLDSRIRMPLPDFRPWSPEHPNLYTARVDLVENGMVVQTRFERFGVRKLEVRGREFYLNGRPFFMRGAGWSPIFPFDGCTPCDRDRFRRYAARIRSAGFNFCRFHTTCPPPELFEACDEAGLMLQPELPYYNDIPATGQLFDPSGDAEELYLNYRRHPSFAVYSGGNEGMFAPRTAKRLYEEIRRRDPDRIMIAQDCRDNDWTNKEGTSDYEGGPNNVWPRGSVNPEVPFVCHEYLNLSVKLDSRIAEKFTGVWLPPMSRERRKAWLGRFGLSLEQGDRLQDAQAVMQKTWRKYGIESARLDPYCDGYSYWALQDACTPNGESYSGQALFDPMWDDKPHGDTAESVAVYNSGTCLLLDTCPRLYRPGEVKGLGSHEMFLTDFATNRVRCAGERIAAHFFLAHYGEEPFADTTLRWRLVVDGEAVLSGSENTGPQPLGAVRKIAFADIAVPDLKRACRATLEATLASGGVEIANSWDWWLFPKRHMIDGRGVYVAKRFRTALEGRFRGLADSLERADTVIAPPESADADAARAAGKRLVTIAGADTPANIKLGWWSMGRQVGAVFCLHPALRLLPHDGFLTPMLFRIMRSGGRRLTPETAGGLVAYGEGGDACYSYLAEIFHPAGSHEYRVDGIDLLADLPEADAILEGMLH